MLYITDRSQVFYTVAAIRPSCIIHAAALSMPDICEREQDRALIINTECTRNIVDAAQKYGSRVIYISTAMVFDGTQGGYRETDVPQPVNFYGITKPEEKYLVLAGTDNCIIIRITLQYRYGRGSAKFFSDWLLKNLQEGSPSRLFIHQYRYPTYVFDTLRGIEFAALGTEHAEIYHLTSPKRIDRYSFGQCPATIFNFHETLLLKSQMCDVPGSASRPRDVSLIGDEFYKSFNFIPRAVLDGPRAMHYENRL